MPISGSDPLMDTTYIYTQVQKAVKCTCWEVVSCEPAHNSTDDGESAGHLTVPFLAELHLENAA